MRTMIAAVGVAATGEHFQKAVRRRQRLTADVVIGLQSIRPGSVFHAG